MRALFAVVAFAVAGNAFAQLLTEKQFFTLPQYTTVGGKPIKNVRVGYETYGKLNAAGDNAVFVPHFFSGTSHAAGRYKADDKAAGYWDAIIGPGMDIHPYVIAMLDAWVAPIKLDPNWKGGDYHGGPEPAAGLAQSLKLVTLTTVHFAWAEKLHGYKWASEGGNPADALGNLFAIEDALNKAGQARAGATDASHFVWMAKANQLYNVEKEQARIKAKVLFLPAKTDLLFPPELSRRAADKLRAQGNHVELYEIDGTGGHLDGLFSIGKVAEQIRAFMEK